jgi:hypothetical protein
MAKKAMTPMASGIATASVSAICVACSLRAIHQDTNGMPMVAMVTTAYSPKYARHDGDPA